MPSYNSERAHGNAKRTARARRERSGTTRFDAILAEANRLNKINTQYSQTDRTGPTSFDCSSAVAWLLKKAGYDVPFFSTFTAVDDPNLHRGADPTERLTFWIKNTGEAHMFAEINGKMWGTNRQNPGHAVSWHNHGTAGFTPYHVKGLDEPADIPADADLNTPDGGGGAGTGNEGDGGRLAKAAAFSTYFNLPGIFDRLESMALSGSRSLLNDQPLFPFVQQLAEASLRSFQSLPDGRFWAFFPDYFGGIGHRKAYWEIADIEIINGSINLTDDALATHVFVIGDTVNFDGVNVYDRMQTSGVVNVFNAFQADFLNGLPTDADSDGSLSDKERKDYAEFQKDKPSLAEKDAAINFLRKYGARPFKIDMPLVRHPFYEQFLAYQKFCLLWSKQFLTTFEFTFMPELYPGGIVAFPDHGIQCFVDEVVHECDYERGFLTRANLSAPSALEAVKSERPTVHAGMIRSFKLSANVPQDRTLDPKGPKSRKERR